jgi:phosphoglycerate kinase
VGDYFVNDAFAVSHRVAASVVGVPLYIPSFGGLLLEKELLHLGALLKKPAHPFIVIIGGGKAIDKLPVIKSLARTADLFLLAGASANTLYALQGGDIQDSLIDNSLSSSDISYFKKILVSKRVVMPVDYQWSNRKILDIGSRTASIFREHILSAKTILWSGPAGLFEKKKFATGSIAIARAILANRGAVSITGGGETVEFLKQYNLDKGFTFISTGGSALLRFLSRQKLPGIEVLKK